jgi:succinate-semialdehyde dehydrogenase / glutarate-semialdehyde dehydrogenase
MRLVSRNPYTGRIMGEFEAQTPEGAVREAEKSREAFIRWRKTSAEERAGVLRPVSALLRSRQKTCAEMITREMGKPIAQSLAEIEKCAWMIDYFAEKGPPLLKEESVATEALRSYIAFEPLGVILGIMPWNFPFWQVFRFAVPALLAGNVCLLKHASNVPATALMIEGIFKDAGVPDRVFKTLLIDAGAAARLVERELVDGVSLTGSVEAGSQIASTAGRHLKKFVLELGGSDAFLVLKDADVARTARAAVQARMINSGQSCIAAKRFIVQAAVADPFLRALEAEIQSLKMGDPLRPETTLGPLAKPEMPATLAGQLEDARKKGARVAEGPPLPSGEGWFFRPAVISRVSPDMRVLTEEVFGPLLPVLVAENEEDLTRLANASVYGLGASIWTRDLKRAEELARSLEAGFVAVNDIVKSDPRLPFGGIKKSGIGRELSAYGLKEFVNIKSVVVREA